MTDVVKDVFDALEELRLTLQHVKISPQLKNQVEEMLTPLFSNPTTCKRITQILNEVGDFSENILVPLLEQYVSANVAIRVRFLVEDILEFLENFRDKIVKQVEVEQQKLTPIAARHNNRAVKRLAANSVTRKYYKAIFEANSQKSSKVQSSLLHGSSHVNASKRVVTKVRNMTTLRLPGSQMFPAREETTMAAIVEEDRNEGLKSVIMDIPELKESGQALVKVIAVALNTSDLQKSRSFFSDDDPLGPQIEQLRALGSSIFGFSADFTADLENNEADHETKPVGIEFVGVVKDIAWQKGDMVHRLPVSKEDTVYGVLRSGGALAEYVVCHVDELSRAPARLGNKPELIAKLGLDGSVALRALANSDIVSPRNVQILIVCGGCATGMMLIEILSGDLNIPLANISCVGSAHQMEVLERSGLTELFDFNGQDWENGLRNSHFDLIFDCSAVCGERRQFEQLLSGKMRRNGQYMYVDPARAIAEKSKNGESWQQEFSLLNSLLFQRKLNLEMFPSPEEVKFDPDEIYEALGALRSGNVAGKLIVRLGKAEVEELKQRSDTQIVS